MKVLKYVNKQVEYITKGLQFFNGKGNLRFVISFTWLKDKRYWWLNKYNRQYKFGYVKMVMKNTTTRSFAIWRIRLSYVTPTK